jgi:hypothetical protein
MRMLQICDVDAVAMHKRPRDAIDPVKVEPPGNDRRDASSDSADISAGEKSSLRSDANDDELTAQSTLSHCRELDC